MAHLKVQISLPLLKSDHNPFRDASDYSTGTAWRRMMAMERFYEGIDILKKFYPQCQIDDFSPHKPICTVSMPSEVYQSIEGPMQKYFDLDAVTPNSLPAFLGTHEVESVPQVFIARA